jgi:hypothetical protein
VDFPLILTDEQASELAYEVVPTSLKIFVTRYLRRGKALEYDTPDIYWQNDVINRCRTLTELPIYVLESDDLGDYLPQEFAWHRSEFELCLRRLNSAAFVEFLAESVEDGWLELDEVNSWLQKANIAVALVWEDSSHHRVAVDVQAVANLNAELEQHRHPNVRTLVARLDRELEADDYSAVLHCSATIFETVAKDVVGIPSIAEQTLGGFFDRYRKDSLLPESVLDYILEVYQRRNTEPLAGHGHLTEPEIGQADAEMLVVLTKAFVTYETRMSQRKGIA